MNINIEYEHKRGFDQVSGSLRIDYFALIATYFSVDVC